MMSPQRRVVVLVLDGFGVGEMADVIPTRPQDHGAHTLRNIIRDNPSIDLRNFINLGAISYFCNGTFSPKKFQGMSVSLGKINLAHFGADSYMGHQEIAGTKPKLPVRQFVRDEYSTIINKLKTAGITGMFQGKFIEVEDHIAIADNIETDYGLNINVVGSLDYHSYEQIEKVGRLVREVVKVGRVITMGGKDVSQTHFHNAFEIKKRDGYTAWGINIPKLGIYNDHYRVIHMGYGISPETQAPQILRKNTIPVVLIGKTADVIVAGGATYIPEVQTEKVLSHVEAALNTTEYGLIFANVQQTDLSGHEMDVVKYSRYLEMVDKKLPDIVSRLREHDVFIITGDHGNDPTIGHTNHTREQTPLMVFSKSIPAHEIGIRDTLADIGASVSHYFNVEAPESGSSFLP